MIRLSRLLLLAASALIVSCAKTTPSSGGLGDPCVDNHDCASGFLCAAGRCVLPANLGGCEPGRKRCNGADVEVCAASGLGWTLDSTCATGCSGGACRPQTCEPGTRRCEGDAAEACTPAGDAWALVQVCPSHCDAGTGQCKAPICAPFATRCDPAAGSNAAQTCDSFGAAWTSAACGTGKVCDGGRCLDMVCTPSQSRCSVNGGSVELCNAKGDGFTASEACPFGCGASGTGALCQAQACTANQTRCTGSAIEGCRPDLTGYAFVTFCATGCVPPSGGAAAHCAVPVCVPGARRCAAIGGNVEICSFDGTGWTGLSPACAQGCAGGQCVSTNADCQPGDLRCNGTDAQACGRDAQGATQWTTTASCLAGCSSGACNPGGSCDPAKLRLNAAVATVPIDPSFNNSVLVYSDVILGADGARIPDGTAFSVSVTAPLGTPPPGLGTPTADQDGTQPGVQVRSLEGRIHFTVTAPRTAAADFTATATAALVSGSSCTASVPIAFTSANAGTTILVAEDFSKTTLRNLPATSADWNTGLSALVARWPVSAGGGEDGPLCVTSTTPAPAPTAACPAWTVAPSFDLTASGYAPAFQVLGLVGQTATLDAPAQRLSGGDEVLLWDAQGSASGVANAGTYELLHVASVDGSTVTFAETPHGTYGAVADGNVSTQKISIVRVPHFSDLTLLAGSTLTAAGWNGTRGGVLALRVSGTAKIQGQVSMDGSGYRGGASTGSFVGEDQTGFPSQGAVAGGGAGGFASGGSFGTQGTGGTLGQPYGLPLVGRLFLGAGGGGNSGAPGGNGGGAVLLFANRFTLAKDDGTSGGRIHADGGAAANTAGAGAGGTVWISAPDLTLGTGAPTNTVSAGGRAGTGGGGSGGLGRVRIDFQTSADATPCARTPGSCTIGVGGPLVGQSLDAYDVPSSSSASLKQATLVLALGTLANPVFLAAASNTDPPDFGVVPAAASGPCPASTVCFNSTATTPTQGARFRWKAQLFPQPGVPQSLQALQWSLKAQ